MSQVTPDGKAGKRRERKIPKRASSSPGKEKVTFYLSEEAIQRVGITATMEKKSNSIIVEELINMHLRKWVVSCRGQRLDAEDTGGGQGGGER